MDSNRMNAHCLQNTFEEPKITFILLVLCQILCQYMVMKQFSCLYTQHFLPLLLLTRMHSVISAFEVVPPLISLAFYPWQHFAPLYTHHD